MSEAQLPPRIQLARRMDRLVLEHTAVKRLEGNYDAQRSLPPSRRDAAEYRITRENDDDDELSRRVRVELRRNIVPWEVGASSRELERTRRVVAMKHQIIAMKKILDKTQHEHDDGLQSLPSAEERAAYIHALGSYRDAVRTHIDGLARDCLLALRAEVNLRRLRLGSVRLPSHFELPLVLSESVQESEKVVGQQQQPTSSTSTQDPHHHYLCKPLTPEQRQFNNDNIKKKKKSSSNKKMDDLEVTDDDDSIDAEFTQTPPCLEVIDLLKGLEKWLRQEE